MCNRYPSCFTDSTRQLALSFRHVEPLSQLQKIKQRNVVRRLAVVDGVQDLIDAHCHSSPRSDLPAQVLLSRSSVTDATDLKAMP